MNLQEVKEFKEKAHKVLSAILEEENRRRVAFKILRANIYNNLRCPPKIGIHPVSPRNYQLAIRARYENDIPETFLQEIQKQAAKKGDQINLRLTGYINFISSISGKTVNINRSHVRPLCSGISISQEGCRETTGTLGCFVRKRYGKELLLLSNSHILAQPEVIKGWNIMQPSPFDGGAISDHRIAQLEEFIDLSSRTLHRVDVATAQIKKGVDVNPKLIFDLGELQGFIPKIQQPIKVLKTARTTNVTYGKISAFNLDVDIHDGPYGKLRFENQIEIEPLEQNSNFAREGDSGALIINEDLKAIGLLFSADNQGFGYANPFDEVLNTFNLVLA